MRVKIACLSLLLVIGCSTIPASKISVANKQLKCLAEAIHGEARGESKNGKIFVGRVVLTRVQQGFAPTICSAVYAESQFAPRGDFDQRSLDAAIEAKKRGPNGITHFHSYPEKDNPSAPFAVSSRCDFKTKVGGHWGYACQENRSPASLKARHN